MDEPDVADTIIRARPSVSGQGVHPVDRSDADPDADADAHADADADIDGDTRLRDRGDRGAEAQARSTVLDSPPPVPPSPPEPAALEHALEPALQPALQPAPPTPAPPAPRFDPAVYRVSINGGAPVPLDVRTIVGRAPRVPRVPSAVEPRLVVVDSADKQVSGTHLELRQEGRSVVVTDLHSTNGTIVTMPGAAPVRLRPGDSLVAGPGAVVDVGDGNSVEILPVGRLTAEIEGMSR